MQTIERMGKWLHDVMRRCYLKFFKPDGLLAMGKWPGAEKKEFGLFWAERFHPVVSEELTHVVFPWLRSLDARLKVCVG